MNRNALGKGFLVALGMHLALAVVVAWACGLAWLGEVYGLWATATGFLLTTVPIVVTVVYRAEVP